MLWKRFGSHLLASGQWARTVHSFVRQSSALRLQTEIEDTFKFTISAQPSETGVVDGRENIEIEVLGQLLPRASSDLALSARNKSKRASSSSLALPMLLLFYRVGMPKVQHSLEQSRRGQKVTLTYQHRS